MLTALFIGLGSIGTRHLKNLTAICAQRGLALRADALRSDLARPLRPGAAELLHSQFTTLQDSAALPHYDLAFITNPTSLHAQALEEIRGLADALFIEKPIVSAAVFKKRLLFFKLVFKSIYLCIELIYISKYVFFIKSAEIDCFEESGSVHDKIPPKINRKIASLTVD